MAPLPPSEIAGDIQRGPTTPPPTLTVAGGVGPQSGCTPRADLRSHPAFAHLSVDTSGNPCVWRNHYECEGCGAAWHDEWSCGCDDECSTCERSCSPNDGVWIGPCDPEFETLWEGLPEAGDPEGDAAATTPFLQRDG